MTGDGDARTARLATIPHAFSLEETVHLCARLARLLLANGADADYTLHQVGRAADALGQEVHVQLGDGAVTVTADTDAGSATRVGRPLPRMTVDMARLNAIDLALGDLSSGRITAAGLGERLIALDSAGEGRAAIVAIPAVALTAASLARLFGATWPVAAVAFVAVAAGASLRRRLERARINPIGAVFAVALMSGLLAALLVRALPGQSATLALSAAGMVLVPGVPLINGVRDLTSGHAGLASVRLAVAVATVLAIGFALFLAAWIAATPLSIGAGPAGPGVGQDLLFSGCAVVGYVVLFNVSWRALPIAVLCGALSHGSRTALMSVGVNVAAGSLVGAVLAGTIGVIAGHHLRVPAVTFAFPGSVAMIPGAYGFRAGIGGLKLMTLGAAASPSLVAETFSLAITTAVITIAIGVGLSIAFALPLGTLASARRVGR